MVAGSTVSTLSERLARLRAAGKAPEGRAHPGGEGDPSEAAAREGAAAESSSRESRVELPRRRNRPAHRAGVRSDSAAGGFRDSVPPGSGWTQTGDFLWERLLAYPPVLPDEFPNPFVLPESSSTCDLVFYDLETTGLSGGAGNTAFLIGLGFQKDGIFSVIQLFLADYPGESAMLERYAALIGDDLPQVSYNGRSFDSQVLRTRFLLNRMPPPSPPQVDLLYPARRLWGGILPNAALGTLEREVLGFFREDDLPGSEAPEAWFSWLEGDGGRIEGVFRHNADDIVSLARLLAKIEEWGRTDPMDFAASADGRGMKLPDGADVSPLGMARQWAFRDEGLERRWLGAGWELRAERCGRELALRRRREGNLSGAREIWEALNAEGSHYEAAVELAKQWEHARKNPGKALEIVSRLEDLPLSDHRRRELEHRLSRLRRKAEGSS